jgi:hypothetical protein
VAAPVAIGAGMQAAIISVKAIGEMTADKIPLMVFVLRSRRRRSGFTRPAL